MNDDWRVKTTVASAEHASELAKKLGEGDLEHKLETAAGQSVVVSHDGDELFVYAGSRQQAEAASDALRQLDPSLDVEVRHWDSANDEWESPDAKPPSPEVAEEELIEQEREDSEEFGFDEYEVRVELHSHSDTRELAERLEGEGYKLIRRWRFLLIGVEDEETGNQLANRIRLEAPADAEIKVEGSYAAVQASGPSNPFRYFGGLGG